MAQSEGCVDLSHYKYLFITNCFNAASLSVLVRLLSPGNHGNILINSLTAFNFVNLGYMTWILSTTGTLGL